MNPYHQFVTRVSATWTDATRLPLGGLTPAPRSTLSTGAPRVLIFSPHPDDECIIGGVALRLMREAGFRVTNIAVTQGSNPARQSERWTELQAACDYLGFELIATAPGGLERISPKTREQDATHWSACVEMIAGLLVAHQPRVILFPHDSDWNSTHIGTHHLVVDAFRHLPAGFVCHTVETEFWGQMTDPNLMVELSEPDVADMLAALSFHVGEVKRNPYHLTVPAWMMDNVRRAEIVGGQGSTAPDFRFATIYRSRRWVQGDFSNVLGAKRFLSRTRNPAELFG